jgi:hypothetical protein
MKRRRFGRRRQTGCVMRDHHASASRGSSQEPQARDARAFRAIQSRIDGIEATMPAIEKEADNHYRIAYARLAELDDLAERRFALIAALAALERRLIRAASPAPANGRAAP